MNLVFGMMLILLAGVSTLLGKEAAIVVTPLDLPAKGKDGFHLLATQTTGLSPKSKYFHLKNVPIRETGHSGLGVGDVDGRGDGDVLGLVEGLKLGDVDGLADGDLDTLFRFTILTHFIASRNRGE